MNKVILLLLILLTGCSAKSVKPINQELIKPAIKIKEQIQEADFSQIKLIEIHSTKQPTAGSLLNNAIKTAKQQPAPNRFLNAITVYDFVPGAIYQIYTAPQKVTMLSFEIGEKLVDLPQGGDTIRWQLHKIKSGAGANSREHLIIKPSIDGLTNNIIISTNHRVYLLELISLKNSYMFEVSWNYIAPQFETAILDDEIKPQAKKFNFKYKLTIKHGKPRWKPTLVFDDGQKTFIQFPESIQTQELPVLFIKTQETNTQLVNYRHIGDCFIIDRLFEQAELRLGRIKPEVIEIKRTSK